MALSSLLQIAALILLSFSAAVASLLAVAHVGRTRAPSKVSRTDTDKVSFLFEDEFLVDATDAGRALIGEPIPLVSDWQRLTDALAPQFPDLAEAIGDLPERKTMEFLEPDGPGKLIAEWRRGLIRLVVLGDNAAPRETSVDADRHTAMLTELETLRATAEAAPFLVWRTGPDGNVTWANSSYLDLARRNDPDHEVTSWPPPRLFPATGLKNMDDETASSRISVHLPGETDPRWFECVETPVAGEILFTAVEADQIVRAEHALRDFVQTLTKTFAHLKTGLAIFDKQRRLALFNPALTDLTSLPSDFLSARPTMFKFLDRLRDKRMVPEQRDYTSWRQQMTDLEAAAENGTYEETWSLASGQTYLVTGHPHPNGGLAFLFEDISAEVSLTRRFRMELETGQAVLDSLDEAIAVFSSGGVLTLSNAQYAKLWGHDPSNVVEVADLVATTRMWSENCSPTPVWGDFREFVGTLTERAEWTADVRLSDGRNMHCRFAPLAGGGTLAGFTLSQAVFVRARANQPEEPEGIREQASV